MLQVNTVMHFNVHGEPRYYLEINNGEDKAIMIKVSLHTFERLRNMELKSANTPLNAPLYGSVADIVDTMKQDIINDYKKVDNRKPKR